MLRPLLAIAVSVAAVVAPLMHGFGFMGGFNTTPPAELAARVTQPLTKTAPSDRVVLVIVDGLRADKVPLLGLPAPAARCALETVVPSYSRPAYVALSTGVPPGLSGVHTNDHEGAARLESIWDVARASTRKTALVSDGTDWWVDLFPSGFDRRDIVKKVDFPAWFAEAPAPAPGELQLLHIVAVDDAGHDFGAMSQAYDDEARAAGALIRALMARLDLARADVLLVTADHGHIDRGGHGGPEPEVMNIALEAWGARVLPNDRCEGSIVDVPATLAALIDVPPPGASLGRALPILRAPKLVPQQFEPPTEAPARALSIVGLALGLLALLAVIGVVAAFVGKAAPDRRPRLVAAAFVWPVVAALAYVVMEPTLSLSAVWLEDPWTLRMIAVLGVPALVTAILVQRFVVRDAWRGLLVWSLGALVPFAAALGLHGSLAAGPALGDPHAAFALIVADLVAAIGAGVGLLVAVGFAVVRRQP